MQTSEAVTWQRLLVAGAAVLWLGGCGGTDGTTSPSIAGPTRSEILKPQTLWAPQPGFWWNPQQSGRGYTLELQGNTVFFTAYAYEADGQPAWYTGSLTRQTGNRFNGTLDRYRGGQTLLGSYRAPSTLARAATVTLDFDSARTALLELQPVDGSPAQSMAIERFLVGAQSTGSQATSPESGYWWNASQSGRGFVIDLQGTTAIVAGYLYGNDGQPVWHLMSGPVDSNSRLSGPLQNYANGPTLTGSWKPATLLPTSPGQVTLSFASASSAQLVLPNGETLNLSRLDFAATSAVAAGKLLYFRHCAVCHSTSPWENKDRVLSGANAPDYILATILRSTFGMGYLYSEISEADAASLASYLAQPTF